jgi:hypothetical protein
MAILIKSKPRFTQIKLTESTWKDFYQNNSNDWVCFPVGNEDHCYIMRIPFYNLNRFKLYKDNRRKEILLVLDSDSPSKLTYRKPLNEIIGEL